MGKYEKKALRQVKKERVQKTKRNKRWTEDEVQLILNYLQEAPKVEAPTAQIFYKKFIQQSGIDATWDLLRWKVRHLKMVFKKANDLLRGCGLCESDAGFSSIEDKVLQICPHYNQLNEIFGENAGNGGMYPPPEDSMVDDGSTEVLDSVESVEIMLSPEDLFESSTIEYPLPAQVSSSTSDKPRSTKTFPQKAKNIEKKIPMPSAGHLVAFLKERTEMLKIKIDWEKEKFEKDLAFKEKKLKIEEEQIKAELNLKKLECETDERLKILRLEKEERLQKFEIEMKYKK